MKENDRERMIKSAILAMLLTFALCILEFAADAAFGAKGVWSRVEKVVNFPGWIALAITGPGHGFTQLVFPMLFTVAFYFALFWWLVTAARGRASQKE